MLETNVINTVLTGSLFCEVDLIFRMQETYLSLSISEHKHLKLYILSTKESIKKFAGNITKNTFSHHLVNFFQPFALKYKSLCGVVL